MNIVPPNKIRISNSPLHGLGVFATQRIFAGQIIEICPIVDMGLNRESSPILIDYRFNWPQGTDEWDTQVVASGYAMMYNHSQNPNALWRSNLQNKTFEFYAVKEINPDEEILIYYGDVNYWNDGRNHTNVIE
jgi:SET domain-containing protein